MRKVTKKLGIFFIILTMALGIFGAGCKKEESEKAVSTPKNDTTAVDKTDDKKENSPGTVENKETEIEKKYGDVKGFFWEVKKEDTTVYMLGSIHVGDANLYPMHQVVEDAFESSNIVVGEIDMTNTEALTAQALSMMYTNGETALDHMTPEGKEKMDKVCEELNFNPKILLTQKIWSLGSVLSGYQMKKAGYDANYGIDMHFLNRAKGNKTIMELEGAEFQFNMLNNFSDKEQEDNFIINLGTLDETKKMLDELFNIYKSGDEAKMLTALGTEDKNSNFYKKMILERNIGMTSKIEEYLNTGDTYFVIAGLAHFIGDDGIVKMLTDKGYKVTRK